MNADDIARLRAATKKGRIKITSRITIRNRIKSRSRSRNYSVAKKLAKKASFCRCVLRMGQRVGNTRWDDWRLKPKKWEPHRMGLREDGCVAIWYPA